MQTVPLFFDSPLLRRIGRWFFRRRGGAFLPPGCSRGPVSVPFAGGTAAATLLADRLRPVHGQILLVPPLRAQKRRGPERLPHPPSGPSLSRRCAQLPRQSPAFRIHLEVYLERVPPRLGIEALDHLVVHEAEEVGAVETQDRRRGGGSDSLQFGVTLRLRVGQTRRFFFFDKRVDIMLKTVCDERKMMKIPLINIWWCLWW